MGTSVGWSALRAGGFPEGSGPERDQAIVAAVEGGSYLPPLWREIVTTGAGHTASFGVSADAFQLGIPGDSVRIIANHRTSQAVADLLGVVLPTPLIEDAAAAQADVFLDASEHFWPKTPEQTPISTTTSAEEHSAELDEAIAQAGGSDGDLVRGPWKIWANHSRLLQPASLDYGKKSGINYGAHTTFPPGEHGPYSTVTPIGMNVWQPPGGKHGVSHDDASQKISLVARDVFVKGPLFPSGQIMDIETVSLHPVLWPLVSSTGPIPMHHPWLPKCSSLDEGGGGSCLPPGTGGGTGGGGEQPPPPPTGSGYDLARLTPLGIALGLAALGWTLTR